MQKFKNKKKKKKDYSWISHIVYLKEKKKEKEGVYYY